MIRIIQIHTLLISITEMLTRSMYQPIHQKFVGLSNRTNESTADSMSSALVASLVEAPVAERQQAGKR